jgi:hypothetical protein
MGKIIKHSIIENVPFWILAGMSIIIGTIAFFTPPKAEVHPSVLHLISWYFAFAALWSAFVAMIRGIDARVQHGKTTFTVGSLENKDHMSQPPMPREEEPEEETEV